MSGAGAGAGVGASRAILVVDLAFGDCGKGTVVDYLTRRDDARVVVRFNGGPQAGHNVVTTDGRHHTFSQFGSGTFVAGVRTLLSRFVLIEPYALFNEAAHLRAVGVADALDRLVIDAQCPVITPVHQAANRLREMARGGAAHGTCGMGVGEAMQDLLERPETALRARELSNGMAVRRKLREAGELKVAELREIVCALRDDAAAHASIDTLEDLSWIDAAVENYAALARRVEVVESTEARSIIGGGGTVIFEGAQGVLLDEQFGFHPHTTWSTTTFANAETLLDEWEFPGTCYRLGVLRSYFTRHGRGPFVSEDPSMAEGLPEPHNAAEGWQGRFRVGAFDAVAARYALGVVGGVDGLAVTHLDRVGMLPARVCTGYLLDGGRDGADEWFVRSGNQVSDLRVRPTSVLREMQRLTEMLGRCRVVSRPVAGHCVEGLLDVIGRELRAAIVIESHGPTADEKREVSSV